MAFKISHLFKFIDLIIYFFLEVSKLYRKHLENFINFLF